MSKSLIEMAWEIMAAHTKHTPMTPQEMSAAVHEIFKVLQTLQAAESSMGVCDPQKLIDSCRGWIPSSSYLDFPGGLSARPQAEDTDDPHFPP